MHIIYTLSLPGTIKSAIADLQACSFHVDGLLLTRINVPQGCRGIGVGSALLQRICQDADIAGITLFLEIMPSGPMRLEALEAWYIRYGWVHGSMRGLWTRPAGALVRPDAPLSPGLFHLVKGWGSANTLV